MRAGYRCGLIPGAVLVIGSGALAALDDAQVKPEAEARLTQILDDWRRVSLARKSLDVRFSGETNDRRWHTRKPFTGRVVLLPRGPALAEVVKSDSVPKSDHTDRWIWKDEALHHIQPEAKRHTIWQIAAKDRGRLPAVLALPFFWNLSTEGLRSHYRVALVKEEAETWVIRVTPLTEAGRSWSSQVFIRLDRTTYLPRRYLVISPDGKEVKGYRVTDVRCDQPVPDLTWRIPDGDGWEVSQPPPWSKTVPWLSRLSSGAMDLLP